MYFKISKNVQFRQYDGYGYITDNFEFGYGLAKKKKVLGERYVSESASMMIGVLSKKPQHIDDIIHKLKKVFEDVEEEELKKDTIDFFMQFVHEGYLCFGKNYDDCENFCSTDTNTLSIDNESNGTGSDLKQIIKQKDFLRSLHIEITSSCNERCIHCYIPHKNKTGFIAPELFFRIIDEGRALNIVNVTLTGGEPLLHKDIISFLKKCREQDLSVNLLSNLTLLKESHVLEMRENPLLSIQTSLYSMTPSVHDLITKVKGSFESTIKGIKRIKSEGIPIQISCPVMKQNKESFSDVLNWGQDNEIEVVVEPIIFASFDQKQENLSNRLNLVEYAETIDRLISVGYVGSFISSAKEKHSQTSKSPICSICRYNYCISANGNVFPCVGWQTNVLGNIYKQSNCDIWNHSKKIQELREIKLEQFSKCVDCNDRDYCKICMMNNTNENGNPFSISEFHCKTANILHNKINSYLKLKIHSKRV